MSVAPVTTDVSVGSGKPPEIMLVNKDHAPFWVIMIWVTCAGTGAMVMSGPKMVPRAMSEYMVLLQLRSVVISMACVSTGGHWNHAVLNKPCLSLG